MQLFAVRVTVYDPGWFTSRMLVSVAVRFFQDMLARRKEEGPRSVAVAPLKVVCGTTGPNALPNPCWWIDRCVPTYSELVQRLLRMTLQHDQARGCYVDKADSCSLASRLLLGLGAQQPSFSVYTKYFF